MRFLRLTLEHFNTYRDRQELPLADQGLVLIRGNNKLSAAANDNGAGKTSILHALSWVLFGKDLERREADDVACRFTKDPCLVTLTYEFHGTKYEVRRGRRPRRIELDNRQTSAVYSDEKAVNAVILSQLGFGYLTFCNAVVFGQGSFDRFAQANQADQMKMLDEIQGLDFRKALDKAKAWRDGCQKTIDELEEENRETRSLIFQAQTQLAELEQGLKEFEERKDAQFNAAANIARSAQDEVQSLLAEIDAAKKKGGEIKKIREKWERIKELKDEYAVLVQEDVRARMALDSAKDKLDATVDAVRALIESKKCPTCRRSISGKQEAAEIRKLFEPDAKQAEEGVLAAEQEVSAAKELVQKKAAEIERHFHTLPAGWKQVDERRIAEAEAKYGSRALEGLQSRLDAASRRDTTAQESLNTIRKQTWEGQGAIKAAEKQIQELVKKEGENGRQRVRASRTLAAADYWVEAFGDRGLRSLLFDSVAAFLNGALSKHLEVLCAGEAAIEVSALSALKSGQVRERLSIGSSWDWGAGTYTSGSAGQDRRIDLALFAALQDLAESRSARPFPLRAFDEPFDSLDTVGKETACQWVRSYVKSHGTVLVMTHHPELTDLLEANSTWTVVLDKSGSHVEIT